MNLEDTMAFILESQSKAQVRMDRADARMDRADARMDRFDKQLAATRKLVEFGVKELIKLGRETRKDIRDLKESQKATDKSLRMLIHSLQQRTNGHR